MISIEIIDGDSVKVTKKGHEFTRVAKVHGINTSFSGIQKKFAALGELQVYIDTAPGEASVNGIYMGQSYPAWPAARVVGMSTRATSTDIIEVSMVYRTDVQTQPIISISSNANETETNQGFKVAGFLSPDGNDNISIEPDRSDIVTAYTYPEDYTGDGGIPGEEKDTGAITSVLSPDPTITVTINVKTTHHAITLEALRFVGKVHSPSDSTNWNLYGQNMGGPERWLCTDISGQSIENDVFRNPFNQNRNYTVSLSFQRKNDGWFKTFLYIDPSTGRPPSDLEEKGRPRYTVYPSENFNQIAFLSTGA